MIVKWTFIHFQTIKIPAEATHSEAFPYKKNQNFITVNSDLDLRIQICISGDGRVGLSKWSNTNSSFAVFGQPGLQFRQ